MAISHAFTNPVPDGTITSIVRPSDWNSAHNQYYTLLGNTLGNSTVSGTNIVFQGAGNVSLSGTGHTIVVYGTGGGGGTQSVQTQASGGIAGTGFTSTTTAGTAVVGTLNSQGLSLGVPAYVTNAVGGGGVAIAGGTQTATSGTVNFANSNGITFGMSGSSQITASHNGITSQSVQTQASGNIAGAGFTSTTTAGTVIVGTNNSNGLSLGVPAYLTTQSVQTQASGNIARTGFTSTTTAGTAVVGTLNTGGLSLGVPAYLTTQSVQTQASGNIAGSGFTGANATGTLNSNGLSLSVAAPGAANYSIGVSNLGNTAGSTGITGTRIVFVGTNNISLSQSTDANGATISINQTGGGGGGAALSAGTQSVSTGTVNFANSNGISFGMSGSNQITASYTVPTVPTSYVSNVNGSSGQISLNVASSLSASTNGSSITFGLASNITSALQSAGAYLTTAAQSSLSNLSIAVVATNNTGGGTATLASSISFTNANGLTFYTSAGNAIAASYTVPTQSVQTQASGAIAGTGFTSTTTVGTAVTAALGTNGLNMAIPAYLTTQSVQTQASGNIAGVGFTSTTTAGTAVVGTLSTNGLSLGVPAYLTAAAGGNFSGGVSNLGNTAGSTGITGTRIVFVGTNNISLSQSTDANGATISINQTGAAGAMYANLSGATSGNTTASGNTLNFSGINLTLSGTNNSQIAISAPATSSLSAGNNISISSNGSTIGLSAQAVAAAAGTQTATSGTVNFANSNGITFGMSGSNQITASHNGITSQSVQTQASGNLAGIGFTSTTTAGTAVQGTLSTNGLSLAVPAYLTAAVGGGGIAAAAGTQTATSGTVNFANSNGVTFGMSGSNQITASIATSLTNINVSAGTTSNNLSNIVFSNGNGVTFGLNGSTVTASVAPAGGVIASGYSPHGDYPLVVGQIGQGTLALDPDIFPDLTVDQIAIPINFTNASNSTGSFTVSNWVGLYSRNVSSISLAHSTSFSQGITFSGSSNSSVYQGWRNITYPWSTSISGGRYWIAQIMRTTTGGANCSFSQYLASQINTNFLGEFGVATNATKQLTLGQGFYSASTTALPGSIAFTQIQGSNSLAQRFPMVAFGFNTV